MLINLIISLLPLPPLPPSLFFCRSLSFYLIKTRSDVACALFLCLVAGPMLSSHVNFLRLGQGNAVEIVSHFHAFSRGLRETVHSSTFIRVGTFRLSGRALFPRGLVEYYSRIVLCNMCTFRIYVLNSEAREMPRVLESIVPAFLGYVRLVAKTHIYTRTATSQ